MGMGMNHWEREGLGSKKTFPLISTPAYDVLLVGLTMGLTNGTDNLGLSPMLFELRRRAGQK